MNIWTTFSESCTGLVRSNALQEAAPERQKLEARERGKTEGIQG